MMTMETTQDTTAKAAAGVEYGKLPPLNPDDLKPPTPPPATKVTASSDPISVREVYDEMKQKLAEGIVGSSLSTIMLAMRIGNLVLAALMLAIAIAQLIFAEGFWDVTANFFGVLYTLMFATILAAYEMRTPAIDLKLRDNFGFMYGPVGRCLFLCFISVFPMSMMGAYGIVVSVLGFLNAYFNYFVIRNHPSFTRGIPDYTPPKVSSSASSDSGETKQDN